MTKYLYNDVKFKATLPTNAKDARLQGATLYYTGKPCANGHLVPRYTCSHNCVKCAETSAMKSLIKKRGLEYRNRQKLDDLRYERELRELEA